MIRLNCQEQKSEKEVYAKLKQKGRRSMGCAWDVPGIDLASHLSYLVGQFGH